MQVYLLNVTRADVWFLQKLIIVANLIKQTKVSGLHNTTVHDVVFNTFDAQCSSSTSQQHIKYYGGSNILFVYYSFLFQRLIHLCYVWER